jgi:hypothetical protein
MQKVTARVALIISALIATGVALHTHGNGKSHILRNPSRPRRRRD